MEPHTVDRLLKLSVSQPQRTCCSPDLSMYEIQVHSTGLKAATKGKLSSKGADTTKGQLPLWHFLSEGIKKISEDSSTDPNS